MDPDNEPALECPMAGLKTPVVAAVPDEAVLPDIVRPDSLRCDILCVRERYMLLA